MVSIISEWWIRLAIGLLGSGIVGLVALKARALSISGAISAMIMGTIFIVLGEPIWFVLLIVFFISSTFWSKFKKGHRAKKLAEANYEKTGQRDAGQVWANGGFGVILLMGYAILPSEMWLLAYIGVMGAVNADTWATEIGALSRAAPRSIITGKKVDVGTSGGITLLGTIASLGGALAIGLSASIMSSGKLSFIIIGGIAGFAGALVDSILGAKLQAMYRCVICGKETERSEHCGQATEHIRGWQRLNNDWVNIVCSVTAGIVAVLLGLIF